MSICGMVIDGTIPLVDGTLPQLKASQVTHNSGATHTRNHVGHTTSAAHF